MTALKRFTFDVSFDEVVPVLVAEAAPEEVDEVVEEDVAEEEPETTYGEQDLASARDEGFAAGKEEGLRQSLETAEQRAAAALTTIGEHLETVFATQTAANEVAAGDAVSIGLAVVRKILPELARRSALDEVSRLVQESMEQARDEARIFIRVNESLRDDLAARIETLTAGSGFEGQVVLAADGAMAEADCTIEWSNGGVDKDSAAMWREIDVIIERNIGPSALAAIASPANALPADAPPEAGPAEDSEGPQV